MLYLAGRRDGWRRTDVAAGIGVDDGYRIPHALSHGLVEFGCLLMRLAWLEVWRGSKGIGCRGENEIWSWLDLGLERRGVRRAAR